jgi:hypothetical protein
MDCYCGKCFILSEINKLVGAKFNCKYAQKGEECGELKLCAKGKDYCVGGKCSE